MGCRPPENICILPVLPCCSSSSSLRVPHVPPPLVAKSRWYDNRTIITFVCGECVKMRTTLLLYYSHKHTHTKLDSRAVADCCDFSEQGKGGWGVRCGGKWESELNSIRQYCMTGRMPTHTHTLDWTRHEKVFTTQNALNVWFLTWNWICVGVFVWSVVIAKTNLIIRRLNTICY